MQWLKESVLKTWEREAQKDPESEKNRTILSLVREVQCLREAVAGLYADMTDTEERLYEVSRFLDLCLCEARSKGVTRLIQDMEG